MLQENKLVQLLFRNIGLIGLIMGIGFVVFGLLNFNNLPYYYYSLSGSSGFDGQVTIFVNSVLWIALCGLLIFIGIEFYFSGRFITKMESTSENPIALRFFLIAAGLISSVVVYTVLILMNVIDPVQFFPNVLFVDDETLMDFSPVFNTAFLFLILTIIYRVAYKLIKYGIKIGGVE